MRLRSKTYIALAPAIMVIIGFSQLSLAQNSNSSGQGMQTTQTVQSNSHSSIPTYDKHLGVASCASSTCHGSTVAFAGSNVLQNEFRTWNEEDPHARAFKTLLSPESQKIARKLGLKSADGATACLGCHSGNSVPIDLRGESFSLSDGVGCETCHGGAGRYIESHTKATHQDNLSAGLTPLEKPVERAQLCVSCHVGNSSDRKITHEIMGAGHPRLSFEVNTFSSIQPAHYLADADYELRKGKPNTMQLWAIGQLVASKQLLANISAFPRAGLFPELAHMNCLACHQTLSRVDWVANPLTQVAPGSISFNDAHLLSSYQLAHSVTPELSDDLLRKIRGLSNKGALDADSQALIDGLEMQLSLVGDHLLENPISEAQGKQLLAKLVDSGLQASHQGYGSAEQSAMAINSVVLALNSEQATAFDQIVMQAAIDDMFGALANPHDYRAYAFISSLKGIQSALLNQP
ncbi:MAG: multiheme c-type cytochrome [Arenicella sp.]|nr:multiheme c-type cytochrome [Arenicella sp.]